jgi:hypothetical protein
MNNFPAERRLPLGLLPGDPRDSPVVNVLQTGFQPPLMPVVRFPAYCSDEGLRSNLEKEYGGDALVGNSKLQ